MAELTPMMKQYLEIKAQNEDCILFFRLGDFYEMFCEDAKLASRELDLTLTTRDRSKEDPEERVPMCGVPYHSSEAYIGRLIAKGYKVAICEQMEDPALAKGLVKREIIRIITPGTVTDSSMLEEGKNNFICMVCAGEDGAGLCFCDISTGELHATAVPDGERVLSELGRFMPSETIIMDGAQPLFDDIRERIGCLCQPMPEGLWERDEAARLIKEHFPSSAENGSLSASPKTEKAVAALLLYLHSTQKTELSHINTLNLYTGGQFMELDLTARRNLELCQTMRAKEKRGSLLWVLDKTKTPMGGRLIRAWLEKPLLSPAAIIRRHGAVGELTEKTNERQELILALKSIGDMERLMGRIVFGSANCRDLTALAASAQALEPVRALLEGFSAPLLKNVLSRLDTLGDVVSLIGRAVADDPPFTVREGGMIRDGYSDKVDELRSIMGGGKGSLASVEAAEKERTGIKGLKVGYNRVFGYYIEVSRSYKGEIPENYIRKQTLAACERYITPELKELESTILTAKERICALEYELFTDLRQKLSAETERVQRTAAAVAELDVLCSLAETAVKNSYVRPEIDESGIIDIKDGRHPVVERMLSDGLFVPNDCYLDCGGSCAQIITGPNMAGKSTYMRQAALIVLMAQAGSFVPAKSARIGVVDRIFTRIGASDDLASGKSTFMVEMTEVAEILKNATARSLLILDEIGRGTSTYDGMAIARAVLEYAVDRRRIGAKTLFATHYHELTVLEDQLPGVKNYNIAAKKRGDDIVFLRKIVRGGADDSFGVEVARLAGVPDRVVARGREILKGLESGRVLPERTAQKEQTEQISLIDGSAAAVAERLRAIDLNVLTPIEAMNVLFELKKLAE